MGAMSKLRDECEVEPYAPSFSIDDEEAYTAFLDKWGFVVIDNVLPPDQCEASVDAIWKLMDSSRSGDIKRDDPSTWDDMWPVSKLGIFPSGIAQDRQSWLNRRNENIYRVYKHLYQDEDLLVSIDRYNIMRPTRDIEFPSGREDRPEWRGRGSWFHWDLNPWHWFDLEPCTEPERPFEEHGLLFSHNMV